MGERGGEEGIEQNMRSFPVATEISLQSWKHKHILQIMFHFLIKGNCPVKGFYFEFL